MPTVRISEVISSLHVHLMHNQTLEVILVQGPARKLQAIAEEMITQRGIICGKMELVTSLIPQLHPFIHPEDAETLGVREGDSVEVKSQRGRAVYPARVTDKIRPGCCFAPIHWNDVFGENLAINAATNEALDPITLNALSWREDWSPLIRACRGPRRRE